MVDESCEISADGGVAAPGAVHTKDPDAALGEIALFAGLALVVADQFTRIVDDSGVLGDGLACIDAPP